jgi:hypothetical protein
MRENSAAENDIERLIKSQSACHNFRSECQFISGMTKNLLGDRITGIGSRENLRRQFSDFILACAVYPTD